MDKKCAICGRTDMKTENFCDTCHAISLVLYNRYNTQQLIGLYSHVLWLKVVQEITNITYTTLKSKYEAEKLKEEGKLN